MLSAGGWTERLLQGMYDVTARHGAAFPHEVEKLWSTVADNKRNIIPALDYVISKGRTEVAQVCWHSWLGSLHIFLANLC